MRTATPEESVLRRTVDVTRGRVHLVEHTWPGDVRAPAEHRESVHICFLAYGAIEEHRGTSTMWRIAPSVRVSPAGDAHACCYGTTGGRCLVIEPAARDALGELPSPEQPMILGDGRMIALAARIYDEMRADTPHSVSGLVIESIALEMLAQTARWSRRRADRHPPPWLARVQDLVASDLTVVPGLEILARVAGVHRVHVARAFRDHLGCTVGDYVRRLRVRRACELLTHTALPLTDVAMRSGFFDQSHMTRVLRGFIGVTPAALRRDYCRSAARTGD